MSQDEQRLRSALGTIAALANVTQIRGPLENLGVPDHLVDTDGWGPIPPDVKRGLDYAAKIARKALEK